MNLGDRVHITIGVSALAEADALFDRLGFSQVDAGDGPPPWSLRTDGQVMLLLRQEGNRLIGLTYYSDEAEERLDRLEAHGAQVVERLEEDGELMQVTIQSPDGLRLALTNQDGSDMPAPTGLPISRCGKFGEFALPVADFAQAAAFWQAAGFTASYVSDDPYPWGIYSDGQIVLGLHQQAAEQALFTEPTMTYFAPDMAARIAALKADGVALAEMPDAAGLVENAAVLGPDSWQIFLFAGP